MPSLDDLLKHTMLLSAEESTIEEKKGGPHPYTFTPPEHAGESHIWHWDVMSIKNRNAVKNVSCISGGMHDSRMLVFDDIVFDDVLISMPDDDDVKLHLNLKYLERQFFLKKGKMSKGKNPIFPLEASLDQSFLYVFAYDLTDKSEPKEIGNKAILSSPDFMPEPGVDAEENCGEPVEIFGGQTTFATVDSARAVVFMSLVCCKEHNDFAPGGLLKSARIVPHIMVMANVPLLKVSSGIKISRPSKTRYWHKDKRQFELMSDMHSMHDMHKKDSMPNQEETLSFLEAMGVEINETIKRAIYPNPINTLVDDIEGWIDWADKFKNNMKGSMNDMNPEIEVGIFADNNNPNFVLMDKKKTLLARRLLPNEPIENVPIIIPTRIPGPIPVFVTIPSTLPPGPYWGNLFTAYKLGVTSGEFTMVCPKKNADRVISNAIVVAEVIEDKNENFSVTYKNADILRVSGQGAYDNIHIAPTMKSREEPSSFNRDKIYMAPICEHDCLHIHWRWGKDFVDTEGLGWSSPTLGSPTITPGLPFSKGQEGAPHIPDNQELKIEVTGSSSIHYKATAIGFSKMHPVEPIPPGTFSIFFHHGAAYATNVNQLKWAGAIGLIWGDDESNEKNHPALSEHLSFSSASYWRLRYVWDGKEAYERIKVIDEAALLEG